MTDQQFNNYVSETKTVFTSVALRFTSDWQDAQDLLQETLLKVYRSRDTFEEGTNFKNWGLMIMRNTFINEYRKRKVRGNLLRPVELTGMAEKDQVSLNDSGEQRLFANEIISAIDSLDKLYSVPFSMFYQGYEYQEIAVHLALPIGTVKSRIFTARVKLKERLRQYA
ncbi:sigma-70 family RNA polymerase sigma factor [Neolewinella aurantiaca]|uniref:Sigma-70 family RNA polymerase sigma factor n=1 Tax=Neolewinella aurantiaca TaxID=2602767 RepID=A0A5C7FEH9_9BACT|nr:sigma-70 family RNA polymerase sigma factor [Neolewinella aurantiaca]TXF88622.1 sigma-70 family RNA polymerase sigma factor [Neolewinella aurantiaca]